MPIRCWRLSYGFTGRAGFHWTGGARLYRVGPVFIGPGGRGRIGGMGAPRLQVTDEILDRVVFGMENQRERLALDPLDGMLKGEEGGGAYLVPLPPWGPSEGYRLMDRFVGTLPNTVFAGRLRDILKGSSAYFADSRTLWPSGRRCRPCGGALR